jgi:hypothetical protein
MKPDHTNFSKRNLLVQLYGASLLVVGTYVTLFFWLHTSALKLALISGLGFLFLIGLLFTLKTKRLRLSAHFHIISSFLFLFVNAMFTSGIDTPGITWFIICPLVAFISLSTYWARFWLIMALIAVASFYFFPFLTVETFPGSRIWSLICYLFLFPMVYSIIRTFRREVSKKNLELTQLNQMLELEQKRLQNSQKAILIQSERIKQAESAASTRSATLSYYLDQLIEVERMEELHSGNLDYAIQSIASFLLQSMSLKHVSVWQLREQGGFELLKSVGDICETKTLLGREIFPKAYDVLASGAIIHTPGVEARQLASLFHHVNTEDSMIACPYFLEGKFAGFISCSASPREWLQEDIIFIRAMSDALPLAFKSHFRKLQQQLLEEKQREITEINESLERKVEERTNQLNLRNKQLMDFSFTNAHHIRGPICRLMGLQNLLRATTDTNEILTVAGFMHKSIIELDEITRKTSRELDCMIEQGNGKA